MQKKFDEERKAFLEKVAENTQEDTETKKKFEPIDLRKSFHLVTHHGNPRFDYDKKNYYFADKFDYQKTDQYKNYRENNPRRYPGPQQYWKTLPYDKTHKKKKKDEQPPQVDDDGKPKVYYLNREITDKRVYKPMKSHIF